MRGPFDYLLPEGEYDDVQVGSLLLVPFGQRELLAVVVSIASESSLALERLAWPTKQLEVGIDQRLVQLAYWLAEQYCSTVARALALVLPPGVGLSGKPRKRLRTEVKSQLEEQISVGALSEAAVQLTTEQEAALRTLRAALAETKPDKKQFLLHGVTGSGKTEVYLSLVADVLAQGKGAIVLVPEIALTPQTVSRFQARFGDSVALLHSQLTTAQRYDQWLRLHQGAARVCIGPRSAVFAPISKLGLIIVDEEHDSSYKSESDPRYDARLVAAERAAKEGAVVVYGSATPRPESYYACQELRLSKRVDGSELPPVEILDMREVPGLIHPRAHEELLKVSRTGSKAVILLNRRGWSNFLACRTCGYAWLCPNCDVTLVLHGQSGSLSCHHCGYSIALPSSCEQCGSRSLARYGLGTERLESELEAIFRQQDLKLFRLDSDRAVERDQVLKTLSAFDQADKGILLGTQMVAKGHDFPEVTLALMLEADRSLRFPDFRSEERTFQLVAQLAGRAGRSERGGLVLVQTVSPDAPAIRYAAKHDSKGFLAEELTKRKMLNYPPYRDLIRVLFASPKPGKAVELAKLFREQLVIPKTDVLGPAALFRLRGSERSQIVLKTAVRAEAVAALQTVVDQFVDTARRSSVTITVDVDPQ